MAGTRARRGRGGRIRTGDLSAPNRTRYQAAPRPDGGKYGEVRGRDRRTGVGMSRVGLRGTARSAEAGRAAMRPGPRHSLAAVMLTLAVLVVPATAVADGGAGARAWARAASERCENAEALPGQASQEDLRQATLCLMNAERGARGLARLQDQPALERVAGTYARQMVRQRFFDHTSPGGSTMLSRIRSTRYLRDVVSWTVGENLAWGSGPLATPRATVRAWMQ